VRCSFTLESSHFPFPQVLLQSSDLVRYILTKNGNNGDNIDRLMFMGSWNKVADGPLLLGWMRAT